MIGIRERVARFLSPDVFEELEEREKNIDIVVNNRVADVLSKMDPFEPLFKKYHIVFSKEYSHPEENLDQQSQIRLFMWAYGIVNDPSFLHVINFFRNTQGNATLRKAKTDAEWFYGRASLATLTLFLEEIQRLASHYENLLAQKDSSFDSQVVVDMV